MLRSGIDCVEPLASRRAGTRTFDSSLPMAMNWWVSAFRNPPRRIPGL